MENIRKLHILVALLVIIFFFLQKDKVFHLNNRYMLSISANRELTTISYQASREKPYPNFEQGNLVNVTKAGHMDLQSPGEGRSKSFFSVSQWERLVNDVDCKALIRGDEEEQIRASTIPQTRITKQGSDYMNSTENWEEFKSSSGYITLPVNNLEENFPLAFSILMYKDIEQAERLLRSIYRPHNFYCIHVDIKSKPDIKHGMDAIAKCFDNVYIVRDPSDVKWGHFTVLEPDLKCLKLLWTKTKWKYFINLTGQEFPLKTNLELVRILQVYNGANGVEATRKRLRTTRFKYAKGPAPHGIKLTRGNVHVVVSRDFVDYVLHNSVAQDFLGWVKKPWISDETFFTSLNHNPHLEVPGSYKGEPESNDTDYPFLTRYISWQNRMDNRTCYGKYIREVCICGIKDLPTLASTPHFFVNKFHWDYQHYARDCLEEWHFNKTRKELIQESSLNITFYEQLSFLKLITRSRTAP